MERNVPNFNLVLNSSKSGNDIVRDIFSTQINKLSVVPRTRRYIENCEIDKISLVTNEKYKNNARL